MQNDLCERTYVREFVASYQTWYGRIRECACLLLIICHWSVATAEVELEQIVVLRSSDFAEQSRRAEPKISLNFFLAPYERTQFECAGLGSFGEWEKNRQLWSRTLKFHYHNPVRKYISVSGYADNPRPNEHLLTQEDVQYLRALLSLQTSEGQTQSGEQRVGSDVRRLSDLLGKDLLGKLIPQYPFKNSAPADLLHRAIVDAKVRIHAGSKLIQSVVRIGVPPERYFIRILDVIQLGDKMLPLRLCYYPHSPEHIDYKYSTGLPLPAGGLGQFLPAVVGTPLYVYVLDGGQSTKKAETAVKAAINIWSKAGVILEPRIRALTKSETNALVGDDREIGGYIGCISRFDSPAFQERESLYKLKPDKSALAVFFVKGATQSEPEFLQVYIDSDPHSDIPGLTVAHEIGHLFLGAGHVGGHTRVCLDPTDGDGRKSLAVTTSGLMDYGNYTPAISSPDAALARKKILGLPDARWW